MIKLLEATQDYWRKLDRLEAAYHQGERSLEEVDAEVAELMAELGRKRREAWRVFLANLNTFFQDQQVTVLGLGVFSIIAYAWLTV